MINGISSLSFFYLFLVVSRVLYTLLSFPDWIHIDPMIFLFCFSFTPSFLQISLLQISKRFKSLSVFKCLISSNHLRFDLYFFYYTSMWYWFDNFSFLCLFSFCYPLVIKSTGRKGRKTKGSMVSLLTSCSLYHL